MHARILLPSLILIAVAIAPSALSAKECKFGELTEQEGRPATITAKIKGIEPQEDNPKQLYLTIDNTGTDHCFSYIGSVPKASLGTCAVGKTVTATGKVQAAMDAWWGLEKVTAIKCK